ncbi:MAG: hypothetical protein L6Q95_02100 [Planctomycetes bacterium]|nr:hypothetical protein [Planctomycetota bacterium]
MNLFGQRPPHPGTTTPTGADRAHAKVDSIEQRLDLCLLTMEAMWTLLRDRLKVTDEELAKRVLELDESDGILDGKVRRPPRTCPHCGKRIPGRFPRCLYCGEAIGAPPFA